MRADGQTGTAQAHPSDQELLSAAAADAGDAPPGKKAADAVRQHLLACEICQLRHTVLLQGGWSRGTSPSGHCPEPAVWYGVAAGTVKREDAEQLLSHASQCGPCSDALREAVQIDADFSADEDAAMQELAASRPEWPREFARRLVLESSGAESQRRARWLDWRTLIAAAAATAAIAVFGWQAYLNSSLHVERLVASSYRVDRSIEYRLPDTPYAPLSLALRDEGSEPPQDLSDALAISRRKAADHPNSARWQDLKGRTELLAGKSEKAIVALLAAEEQEPHNLDVLNDLSVAYAQRWGTGKDPADLDKALHYSDKALSLAPKDSIALFNRALLEKRAEHVGNAISKMKEFLLQHPDSPWAPEAKRKLAEWEQSERKQSAAPDQSPDGYLGSHGDSEIYVESAVREWLPRRREPSVATALQQLSQELASQHEDLWLRHLLAQPLDDAGILALASAARSNLRGDYSGALAEAGKAHQQFQQVGAHAAMLRADYELTYAERRLLNARVCAHHGRRLIAAVQGFSYPYLESQALIDTANCEGFLEQFGNAMEGVNRAIGLAEGAHLRIVRLRGKGFKATFEADQGNPRRMWEICEDGLSDYWRAWAPDVRAQHFLVEMQDWAEKAGEWSLAKSVQQEVLYIVEDDPDDDLKAMAHFRMARDAIATDEVTTADREFRIAADLFQRAPDQKTAQLHAMESRVGLAAIQMRRGSPDEAQRTLDSVDPLLQNNRETAHYLAVEYQGVRGDVARAQGRGQVAEAAYTESVRIAERALPVLNSAVARSQWSDKTEHAYRELAAILIARGDTDAAWRLWQKRCSTALGRHSSSLAAQPIPEPRRNRVRLTYLVLDDNVAIWYSAATGNQFHLAAVNRDSLERDSLRLMNLCSTPDVDLAQFHALARQLYQELVAPFEPSVEAASAIVVQPDATLAGIPFEVLENASGVPLGERHPLVYSPSIADREGHSERLGAGKRLILLGDSTSAVGAQAGLEQEVGSLQQLYPGSVVLTGHNATRETLASDLPTSEMFEFVGHGRESFTGAGLLVREEEQEGDSLILDARLLESAALSRMKLAVLSACSTARGPHGLLDSQNLVLSFLRAEAGAVVASRWDVDSVSTARLMTAFHKNMTGGKTIPEALWMASNEMRQRTGGRPFYWAGFSVYE